MAWDLQLDLQSGDLVFNANRDLASVVGPDTLTQRIHIRLLMERGSFLFDETGTLGSRLNRAGLRLPMTQAKVGITALIREALAPMNDITINSIVVETPDDPNSTITDSRLVKATINFSPAGRISGISPSVTGTTTVNVTLED